MKQQITIKKNRYNQAIVLRTKLIIEARNLVKKVGGSRIALGLTSDKSFVKKLDMYVGDLTTERILFNIEEIVHNFNAKNSK